ncbi:hypothetical protein BHE74_00022031 [Ensete ventricosum]|nr:hypothetical protein BHE74_00022031 [Ensete ventricosum]
MSRQLRTTIGGRLEEKSIIDGRLRKKKRRKKRKSTSSMRPRRPRETTFLPTQGKIETTPDIGTIPVPTRSKQNKEKGKQTKGPGLGEHIEDCKKPPHRRGFRVKIGFS